MLLNEYQWSRNPRGIHNAGVFATPHYDRYRGIRAGWIKLVSAEDEYVDNIQTFLAAGITPIVRLYRAGSCGLPADTRSYGEVRRYVQAGARWFELWNEPNLGHEWPGGYGHAIDPRDTTNIIAPLMNHWLDWAERVIALGGYPGFIPLAESAVMPLAAIPWIQAMMNYLNAVHHDRFLYVVRNGLWCATHPYIYNHFYQEMPGGGPLSARPPEQQNAAEGGWHFQYPYDPISQASDPGRTVWGGTPSTPLGDPVGLIAMGRAFMELLQRFFGSGAVVPVVASEGGIWPWPGPDEGVRRDDSRFPGFTWESHAEATAAMFDWIANAAPPWFFGLTLWKEDDYYDGPHGVAPAVRRLEGTSSPPKNVPAIGLTSTGGPPPVVTTPGPPPTPEIVVVEVPEGPGPVHGTPDYHFVLLAPGLNADWFFQAAEAYWARFRPTVMDTDALIALLPYHKSLAVTVIAPPDQVARMNEQIRERWPTIWYDLVIAETAQGLAEVLNGRVAVGRRFG